MAYGQPTQIRRFSRERELRAVPTGAAGAQAPGDVPVEDIAELVDRLLTERTRDRARLKALEDGIEALSRRAADLRVENAELHAELERLRAVRR